MIEAQRRRKNPEGVRQALLDAAMAIAAEAGLGGLSLSAVARRAGVTKGGLFHHFGSRAALIEAVLAALLSSLETAIETAMAGDPEPHGRFTRAYVRAFAPRAVPEVMALGVSMMGDPAIRALWLDWLAARLAEHGETDASPELERIRLAADGLWLAHAMGQGLLHASAEHIGALVEASYAPAPTGSTRSGER